MKFTPGPWVIAPNGYMVVLPNHRYISAKTPYDSQETIEANARLIAAAPELLEACEQALELLKNPYSMHNEFPDGDFNIACPDNILKLLQSAIAKARGE